MSDEQKYLVNTYEQLVAAVTAKLLPRSTRSLSPIRSTRLA